MANYRPNKAGFLGTHFKGSGNREIVEHLGDYVYFDKQCVKGIFKREFFKLKPIGKLALPSSRITFCYNVCDYPQVSCDSELIYCGRKYQVREIEDMFCGMICLILQLCDGC